MSFKSQSSTKIMAANLRADTRGFLMTVWKSFCRRRGFRVAVPTNSGWSVARGVTDSLVGVTALADSGCLGIGVSKKVGSMTLGRLGGMKGVE